MNLESLNTHPLIFPAFNNSISPLGDTSVYAEIALKIFKKLKLRDLCQAKLVCKEWKQLIKSSFLDEEEAYTQALKRAIQKEDPIQEGLYLERLGDLYVRKATSETLLQAAGLYNYALHNASLGEQAIIKERLSKVEILLSKACTGGPVDIPKIIKQFGNNREGLKKFREKIEEKIQALGSDPSPEEVRELYSEIAQQIKAFFEILVKQSVDILGAEPCEYAMIGFGSLAREEVTPYSDLEFGILIKEDNPINRGYFKHLTSLIHLKVINLGETILPALDIPCLKAIDFFDSITPRGFAFDGAGVEGKGCKTPFGNGKTFELIQTPKKMAQYVGKNENGQWWHDKESHLPMELLNFTHLLGNNELTEQYRQKVQEKLNIPYREDINLRQHLAKYHLVQEDMIAFNPGMGDLGRQGMLFKVKNDFYRFPHLALDRLALLKEIVASDTFGRIVQLNKLGVITEGAAEKLQEWMSTALFMRLKTYSHYEAQKEMMNPLIKPFGFDDPGLIKKQFVLDYEALKNIKKIYRIFIPFYHLIQEFLAGNENKLKSSDLEDNSLQTQGDIALRLLQYEEAKKYYRLAKELDSHDPYVLGILGIIYENQGKLAKATKYVKKSLNISLKLFGENHFQVATQYSSLGSIYQNHGDLGKAAKYVKKALAINLKFFGENHPVVAIIYNNLSMIYKEQGKLEKAVKCIMKACLINHKLSDKNHPNVSNDYNNLASIYEEKGNIELAAEYLKKSLIIDLKLFGENHPRVAVGYNNLGQIYQNQGDLEQAIEYAKKALAIDLKLFGENYPALAIRYNNIGQIYQNQGDLEQAAEYAKKALAINLKLFGENHKTVARDYSNLGQIYQNQGDLKQAAEYAKKALTIDLKLFGENHKMVAIDYNNLGGINLNQGNLKQAAAYFEKALAIDLKLFGENYPALAIRYNNLGQIYQNQGNLEQAAEYAKKALAIDLKLFGENHQTVARNYSNLGKIYQNQGNLEQEVEYTKKALAIDLKLFGENHKTVAIDYNNLGQIYLHQGDLEQAAEYAQKAFAIDLKLFGENHPAVARDYNNLGIIYKEQGDLEQAAEYAKKALSIHLKLFGENHPDVARDYNNLGLIHKEQGDLEQAAEYAKKALAIDFKLFGENHPDVARDYNNLGTIYLSHKDLKQSIKYAEKALAVNLKLFGENHYAVAINYNTLGAIYQQKKDIVSAIKYTKEALRINIRLYGIHHPTTATINANLQQLPKTFQDNL
ncbi:Uncharacterized protein NEOC65_002337 [Neochlamydia sp. AcF65]|uniref:tetratricopeptide repeat protein n=1 Tax=Neochlamydia sp. AcF65 TaxID=2795735 RepID=UPI001BC936B0|nr:tetratricopeptide repeat protein [Neochlamydia sp. AcF65]MBS4167231.1 Uncharacterized protein [Neochlamydia sp. AcF65]